MTGTKASRVCARRHGKEAFTLIELLVVISTLTMLMALLLPVAERARKRAKATACLARVRQWGLAFKMYTDNNGGRWFDQTIVSYTYDDKRGWLGTSGDPKKNISNWVGLTAPYWSNTQDFAACPMATKGRRIGEPYNYDAFTAWWPKEWPKPPWFSTPSGEPISGAVSYGLNDAIAWPGPDHRMVELSRKEVCWGTCDVRGAARVPVLFDSANNFCDPGDFIGPPLFEAGPFYGEVIQDWPMCINRHDGGVNMLFMDWSVRKVGLKELWTLKWYRIFNTAGPWTRAGGVLPEDWPQWMRRFKDY